MDEEKKAGCAAACNIRSFACTWTRNFKHLPYTRLFLYGLDTLLAMLEKVEGAFGACLFLFLFFLV